MLRSALPWVLLGALAACGGAGVYGYRHGLAVAEIRHSQEREKTQAELYQLGSRIAQLAGALEAARAEQVLVTREMEDAARNDPDNSPGLSAERMQRLYRRWGAP